MKSLILFSLLTLTLVSCGSQPVQPSPALPETPIVEVPKTEEPTQPPAFTVIVDADCKPYTWSNEFDSIIKNAIKDKTNIKKLNKSDEFFVGFFKALAKAESCLNPTTRYVEPPSLGKDIVTGQQNTSEGYLQLSYQDSKIHGCNFDWSIDKSKNVKDPTKTIFNAKNNFECGAKILDNQIKNRGVLVSSKNYYWAVLNTKNKRYKEFITYLKKEGFSL